MIIVQAPAVATREPGDWNIFLAGGITNCPNSRKLDVEVQLGRLRPDVKVVDSLPDLAQQALAAYNK